MCAVSGGTLAGGPFTFCVDGEADNIPADGITLSGNAGSNSQWVVTDDQGYILGLPASFTGPDFDAAGIGVCFVWHLSFEDGLTGLAGGNNISQLDGCYDLSNSVQVVRRDCGIMACETPTNVVVTNVDSRRTRIDWDEVEGVSRYSIEIRFAGQTRIVGRGLVRSNSLFVFAPAGRDYEIRIQTLCQNGETSDFTDFIPYSTPASLTNSDIAQSRNKETDGLAVIEILEEKVTDIAIYPNPVSNLLSVEYQTTSNTGVLTITHISGKQLIVNQLAEDTDYHSIDLNHLSSGAYILMIQEQGKLPYTQRIIKESN